MENMDVQLMNLPSSSRIMRNIAEKQRRDKLNGFISELSSLLPTVASAPRKLDKISTLRLAASYIRLNQSIPDQRLPENGQTVLTSCLQVDQLLTGMDMIQIVLSSNTGKIMHVSENVDEIISFNQVDMLGIPFYSFVHPEDQILVKNHIAAHPKNKDYLLTASPSPKRTCTCFRIGTRGVSRNEQMMYEKATIWGKMRKRVATKAGRTKDRLRHKSAPSEGVSASVANDWVFVGVIRLLDRRLPESLTLLDSLNDVYITKHDMPDAKIINSDHRISTITGYLAGEVLGKSALCYISSEDLPLVGKAMRMMLTSSAGEGLIVYRLITSAGLPVYLKSRGIVEFDASTKSVKSFACVNSVIEEEEWQREMAVMRQQLEQFAAAGSEVITATASGFRLYAGQQSKQDKMVENLEYQIPGEYSTFPQCPTAVNNCCSSLNAAVVPFAQNQSCTNSYNLAFLSLKRAAPDNSETEAKLARYSPYGSVSESIEVLARGDLSFNPQELELNQSVARDWGHGWGAVPNYPYN